MPKPDGFIGRPIPRIEDEPLLRGRAEFVADVEVPGTAHAAIVRSPYPHASLLGVGLEEALAQPGVIDAFSGRDIADHLRPLPSQRPIALELEPLIQAPLAVDTVRYVGEPVAVVLAESRAAAEDVAEMVETDIADLPVVASVEQPDPAPLFPGHGNEIAVVEKASGMSVEEAASIADVVVEEEFRVQRHSSVPLETRGLVARPDADGGVTLWGVAKMPHFTRAAVAEMLGLDEERVRVEPVRIGGGFGVRGELHPEDFLVPFAALRIGRPVRWIEDRVEHLVGAHHARESIWRVRAGASGDGELVFIDGDVTIDIGAYVRPLVSVLAEQSALNLLGPYRVRSFGCRARCVLSNKMGIGTMRAPGRFEATFAREGILDRLAEEAGIDPKRLREKNLLGRTDFPYTTGMKRSGQEVVYDSGDPRHAFAMAGEMVDGERQARNSATDPDRLIGVGVVPFIESTGLGPFEQAKVAVEEPGRLVVRLATTSMGQGHETTFAQIAADAAGVDLRDVVVLTGDPRSVTAGVGTFSSRSVVMGGNAVWQAATTLRERIEKLDPERVLSLSEVLHRSAAERGRLVVESRFESESPTYAYGAHAAVVAVDRSLGTLDVLRYIVVADVGRVINPQVVAGQVQGGVVQGLGGGLLEHLPYSEDGQPLATSFMDYLLPSAHEAPRVELVLIDRARPANPLGVKGAGEIGTIAAGATVAAAARDALRGLGVAVTELPLKPDRLVVWGDAEASLPPSAR